MAEIGWGHLNNVEMYGRIRNEEKDIERITYVGSEDKYPTPEYRHAAHCMIYCRDESVLWKLYKRKAKVLVSCKSLCKTKKNIIHSTSE